MKQTIIAFALILIAIGIVGCLEQSARIAELDRKEYERFCNYDPTHPRCNRY